MAATSEDSKPLAFVIMPFGEGFDEIYNLFLVPTLVAAGYRVSRADDIRSCQNILKDIVQGIANATLVVADLTDSNANVYYELGLAHAFERPVVLLAQEIDELPFDLRSYRVIQYRTHFAEIDRAKKQLADLAGGLLTGDVQFGSPVSDFAAGRSVASIATVLQTAEEDEPGFLDHLVALEEGFEQLGQVITQVGAGTTRIGETTTSITTRLQAISSHPGSSSARQARTLVMGLASTVSDYATNLSVLNQEYAEHLSKVGAALESIVRAQRPRTNEEKEQLRSFIGTLSSLEEGARGGLVGITQMTEALRETPSAERTYNRARDRAVAELRRLAENVEKTIATVSRAREIGETKLRAATGNAG